MNNASYNTGMQMQPEFRQCFKCNYEATTGEVICPRCRNAKFYTSGNIRRRGFVVMACGLFVAGLMGAVAVFVAFLLLGATNNPDSSKKISESLPVLIVTYGLFAALILLGLHFVVTGGWMAIFGKRNRVLVWIMWAMIAIVAVIGAIVRLLLP